MEEYNWLVVTGTMDFMDFDVPFHIWDVIIPIDEVHHFSEGFCKVV